ncbi:transcriptional regulator, RpiR family [Pilibacter termitis]|uniref:Transcriptional regulator, RpiR family n=1 Tax=Pilibacter termitis TaxID=263852 RepID=A0A1T4L0S7_9ENTE|nr:MurR/RpiR family transcriptional regulator [Pilibacter termitis]SJZ48253.1 transcriptional regulator, RpiR family [Pilibacter termitis]
MTLKENISIHFTELTKTDKKITSGLMKSPDILIDRAIQDAAVDLEVSPSAIMRAVKKLGYKGLADFKNALEEYKEDLSDNKKEVQETPLYQTVIESYQSNLLAISECIGEEQLKNIVELVKNSSTTRVLGIGSSGLSAEHLVYSLLYQGRYIEAVTSRTKIFYLGKSIQKNELSIIYTVSGNLSLYKELLQESKNVGAKVIIFTMSHDERLAKYADELVILPLNLADFSRENHLSQLDNRFAFLVFSEILSKYIVEEMEMNNE